MKNMRETDIKDKRGNVIISSGLKVRHKKSQYEYTVDSIVKDKSGKIVVMLKSPETPRFQNPTQQKKTLVDKNLSQVIYEAEPIGDFSSEYYAPEDESPDDLIAVDSTEFEKEYEVK